MTRFGPIATPVPPPPDAAVRGRHPLLPGGGHDRRGAARASGPRWSASTSSTTAARTPPASGRSRTCRDRRITVLHNRRNLGVGGAMKRGYARALADGAEIIVKLDADGQMDPRHIPRLIAPILGGAADYAKGNRFAPARLMPPGQLAAGARRRCRRPAAPATRPFPCFHKRRDRLLADRRPGQRLYRRPRPGARADRPRGACRLLLLRDRHAVPVEPLDAVVADVPFPPAIRVREAASACAGSRRASRSMTASRCVRRLRAKYFGGAWNPGSVKLAAAMAMIVAAAGLAGWRWLELLSGRRGARRGRAAASLPGARPRPSSPPPASTTRAAPPGSPSPAGARTC